jgi:hypothetical protein
MKSLLWRIVPSLLQTRLRQLKADLLDIYSTQSYAQEGEDMILRRIFEKRGDGFYVDIGAHHPKRFSNTYYFYRLGWSGINIDATPGSMACFHKVRPRDINLEIAIASGHRELTLFLFNEPALNSFDEALARRRNVGHYRIIGEQKMGTRTLAETLAAHLPAGQAIDFLSLDVEGLDLDVLQSNDWQRFRPEYILTECLAANLQELTQSPVYQLLDENGYDFFAKTVHTVMFKARPHD